MSKFKKELNFSKKFNSSEGINISLSADEVRKQVLEFIWFFNCTNNVKFLIENNNFDYVDLLYKKYTNEIDKLIKYYELGDIIGESEFFQVWFKDWKNLVKFDENEFLKKLYNDMEFSSFWGDFGITDSSEFRNWGIQITFDAEDRGSISQNGKDQLKELLKSLTNDPENGYHVVGYYNVLNKEERLLPNNLMNNKFFCEPLSYEERIDWFVKKNYNAKLNYETIFDSFKNKNLDYLNWNNNTYHIPKYKMNIIADYNIIKDDNYLEKQLIFNYLFLFYMCKLVNMIPNDIILHSVCKLKYRMKKNVFSRYKANLTKTDFQSFNLDVNEYNLEKC